MTACRELLGAGVVGGGLAAGWYPDPSGRADHRWWDGERWTTVVSVDGEERTDTEPPPLGSPERPAGRPWLTALAVVIVAGIAGVAAGVVAGALDDGPDYTAALAADLEARSRGLLESGEAACVADGMVASFGEGHLQDLELVGEPDQPWPLRDLSDAEERTFATVSFDCIEPPHLVDHLVDNWYPARARTDEERRCLAQSYVNALPGVRMREILVTLYVDEAFDVDPLLTEDVLADVASSDQECGL